MKDKLEELLEFVVGYVLYIIVPPFFVIALVTYEGIYLSTYIKALIVIFVLSYAINLIMGNRSSSAILDRKTVESIQNNTPIKNPGPATLMIELASNADLDPEIRIKAVQALAAYRESTVRMKLGPVAITALSALGAALIAAWTVISSAAAP